MTDDTRDWTSFLGAKAADCAAETMMSLRELCQWMRSPLPLQQPYGHQRHQSPTTWQTGQIDPAWHIWTPSQYRKHNRKSWSWICRPRALEGTTFSQFPVWWTEGDKAKAFDRVSRAVSVRILKDARSTTLDLLLLYHYYCYYNNKNTSNNHKQKTGK